MLGRINRRGRKSKNKFLHVFDHVLKEKLLELGHEKEEACMANTSFHKYMQLINLRTLTVPHSHLYDP